MRRGGFVLTLWLAVGFGCDGDPGPADGGVDAGALDAAVRDGGVEEDSACARLAPIPEGLRVHYFWANQINQSRLRIFDDGRIEHGEGTCCPPETTPVEHSLLDEAARASLSDAIAAVAAAGQTTGNGGPAALGALSGELCVFEEGRAHTVRAYERAGDQADFLLRASTAPEAAAIFEVVLPRVGQQMPTE